LLQRLHYTLLPRRIGQGHHCLLSRRQILGKVL